MSKDLIIFGAGASAGSGRTFFNWNDTLLEKAPPLGKTLFGELQKFDPEG